jgi:hypothetical protein
MCYSLGGRRFRLRYLPGLTISVLASACSSKIASTSLIVFLMNMPIKINLVDQWTNLRLIFLRCLHGVYILLENSNIVYVGETGNLGGRMTVLLDSRHQTIAFVVSLRSLIAFNISSNYYPTKFAFSFYIHKVASKYGMKAL